ncbi:B12-binding domain-containing radical SAM protein [Candidatus Falkowbacteria bacterium]|nr:B12-binding domain-containing radical SAM protein [Candidatus Falkowbacteria bacterium]
MSDVVLFYPKVESKAGLLPAGLLMIAGPLIEKGFKVKLIDQRFEDDWKIKLEKELEKGPLLVGFTVMTGKQILEALAVSRIVKEKSQAKVVWGGVHASLLPEQTLKNKNIDMVVIGEGERTFLELARALKNKEDISEIKGIGCKIEDKILLSERDGFIDLNDLSILPYHLLEDIEYYVSKKSKVTGKDAREMALFTSRGCPHRCGFCYNMKFNRRRWRAMDAERVIKEMEFLRNNFKINAFNIQDDEFFVDAARVERICKLIKEKEWKIEIYSAARVNQTADLMSKDLLGDLVALGFLGIVFGVETGSQKILELINKDITYEQVIKTIDRFKEIGMMSKYCFMAGFPNETMEDFYRTTDFIYKMKERDTSVRIPPIRIFTPYPGIPLWDLCVEKGFKPPRSLEEWASFDFDTVKMPWVTKKLTKRVKNVNIMLSYLKLDPEFSSSFKYKLSLLFGRWIDFRWRNHWFNNFFEKYLIKIFS